MHTGKLLAIGVGQQTLSDVGSNSTLRHLERPANFYAQCKPVPLIETLRDAARELAVAGLLKGHSPDTVERLFASWLQTAERVEHAVLYAAHEAPDLRLVVELDLVNGEATPTE
jgi:hypothetical protein